MILGAIANHSQLWWYVMRGSGLVAFVLLSATVVLGIAGVRKWNRPGWSKAVIGLLHRNLSLLSLVFLGLHIATAVTDKYISVPWYAAFVPATSGYAAVWVSFGAITVDLLAAVIVTSLLRARIGRRAWKAVHWLAYAAWPFALIHAVGSGSGAGVDTGTWWTTSVYALAGTATLAALGWRVARRAGRRPVTRPEGFALPSPPATPTRPGDVADPAERVLVRR